MSKHKRLYVTTTMLIFDRHASSFRSPIHTRRHFAHIFIFKCHCRRLLVRCCHHVSSIGSKKLLVSQICELEKESCTVHTEHKLSSLTHSPVPSLHLSSLLSLYSLRVSTQHTRAFSFLTVTSSLSTVYTQAARLCLFSLHPHPLSLSPVFTSHLSHATASHLLSP